MSVLRRCIWLVKNWLHAFLAPAEDPRQTFAYAYQRQRELLVKVQHALADIAASKNQLEAKTAEVSSKLPQLQEQARRSLIAGREDLARLALQRRHVAAIELHTLEEQVREVQQEEQRLSLSEQRLATQIEAFFARQELIAARYSTAEAQVRIAEALSGVSQELADLGLALAQAEQKAESMEARASAIDHLVEAGILALPGLPTGDHVERRLGELDLAPDVDDQLDALKHEIAEGKLLPPAGG